MTTPSWTIGIDLGGTKMDVGLVDHKGKVHNRSLVPTKAKQGPKAVVDDIITILKELLPENIKKDTLGIGIGIAGQIEKKTGVVKFAPNLGWVDFPLQEELMRQTRMPVAITNDVRAATIGEWQYGAGTGCNDLLCVFVGTGLGGGIVSGGRLLDGNSNTAGEIGHMVLDIHGAKCTCGNYGCFETFAGGWAIARRMKEAIAVDPTQGKLFLEMTGAKTVEDVTAKHVFDGDHKGSIIAKKVVQEVHEALIAGIAGLVNVLNPQRVIMGGGIVQRNPDLVEVIRNGVPTRTLKTASAGLEVVQAQLQGDAGVVGAAAFAMHTLEKKVLS